jgi:hypothetical protein
MSLDLLGAHIFFSASFPSGDRGERYGPSDAGEIASAVTALARAVFTSGGHLVFGGHPTITPLVLLVAAEHGRREAVDVYQSRWFDGEIPAETRRLEELGFGKIRWTPRRSGRDSSLRLMRAVMLEESQPSAAVFIGGMEGIQEEWHDFGRLRPGRPRLAVTAPGGSAAHLPVDDLVPPWLRQQFRSHRYPVAAIRLIEYLVASRDQ